jgi:hypothetical protein
MHTVLQVYINRLPFVLWLRFPFYGAHCDSLMRTEGKQKARKEADS